MWCGLGSSGRPWRPVPPARRWCCALTRSGRESSPTRLRPTRRFPPRILHILQKPSEKTTLQIVTFIGFHILQKTVYFPHKKYYNIIIFLQISIRLWGQKGIAVYFNRVSFNRIMKNTITLWFFGLRKCIKHKLIPSNLIIGRKTE